MGYEAARQVLRHLHGALPHGVRLGRAYRRTRDLLRDSQWWSRDELQAYQRRELSTLVRHAYENVPYYRGVFDERGLGPDAIRSPEDLHLLPILSREDVRRRVDDLIDRRRPRSRLVPVATGGTTTGLPLSLYWDPDLEAREWAFVWRGWNWAGYRQGERRAVLRGDIIGRRGACWKRNPIDRRLIFTCFRMADADLAEYAKRMTDFRPKAFQAYPSTLYLFTLYLRQHGIRIPSVECILTSSEPLYTFQRETVEEHWGVPVFDHYGNSERSVLAMQCAHRGLHLIPEYGVVEVTGRDGRPVTQEGGSGEIVTTGFLNRGMPLLRYQTDDVGVLRAGQCSCGRSFPMLEKIQGRKQDYFVDANGSVLPATFLAEPLMPFMDDVEAYQYVQDEPGILVLRIDARRELSTAEAGNIQRCFEEVYSGFRLRIEPVCEIPRTKTGKFRYLVQNLDIGFTEAGPEPSPPADVTDG